MKMHHAVSMWHVLLDGRCFTRPLIYPPCECFGQIRFRIFAVCMN